MKNLSNLGLVAVLLVAFVLGCANSGRRSKKSPTFDKSPATQAGRKDAIDDLIQRNVFTKVEKPGDLVYVWVGPAFYGIDFEQKKTVMNVVYGYYYEDDSSLIRIFDSMNGKQIGIFSLTLGLEMD